MINPYFCSSITPKMVNKNQPQKTKTHTLMLLARKVSIILLLCTPIINNSPELLAYKKNQKNTSLKYRKSRKHKKKTMKKRPKFRFRIALVNSLCTLAALLFLKPKKTVKAPPGLDNLVNTCFLNATLQCLAHTPPIKKYVESGRYNKDLLKNLDKRIDPSVAPACFHLLEQMYTSKKTYITPRKFVNIIQNNQEFGSGEFLRGRQCDAHELLTKLLETLDESLHTVKDSTLPEQIRAYKRDHPIRYTAINKIFGNLLKSSVTCSKCGKVSETLEPGPNTHSIEILKEKKTTLQDCLKKGYLKKEIIEGNNAYYCSECNEKVTATKQLSFASLPPILVVHLKRFKSEYVKGEPKPKEIKIDTFVKFPIKKWEVPYDSDKNKPSKKIYDLIGVVNHRGSTANSGHYTAYAKSIENNQWYKFNDTTVTKVKPHAIVTQEAYILFYKARD